MPFELRPEPHPTLKPEGDYLQRAWQQSVYPIARRMGMPITMPRISPQPHTHLAFEGYQNAEEHDKGNDYNHRVLEAFFVEGQDIGSVDVLTKLAGEVGLEEKEFEEALRTQKYREAHQQALRHCHNTLFLRPLLRTLLPDHLGAVARIVPAPGAMFAPAGSFRADGQTLLGG